MEPRCESMSPSLLPLRGNGAVERRKEKVEPSEKTSLSPLRCGRLSTFYQPFEARSPACHRRSWHLAATKIVLALKGGRPVSVLYLTRFAFRALSDFCYIEGSWPRGRP